jgi:chromate transporter
MVLGAQRHRYRATVIIARLAAAGNSSTRPPLRRSPRPPGSFARVHYEAHAIDIVTPPSNGAPCVSTRTLFFRFVGIGLSGFGGVMPFAHHMLVEQRRWLDEVEFAEILSMAQFLPGPNIVNVSVLVGRRFQGWRGALAAFTGLMLMPLVVVLALATVYSRFADVDTVRHAFNGVAAAASGLVLAMGIKMSRVLRGRMVPIATALVVFVAIGVLRVPLVLALAVLAPLSIWLAWRMRAARKDAR